MAAKKINRRKFIANCGVGLAGAGLVLNRVGVPPAFGEEKSAKSRRSPVRAASKSDYIWGPPSVGAVVAEGRRRRWPSCRRRARCRVAVFDGGGPRNL